jgi:hypothetical protein
MSRGGLVGGRGGGAFLRRLVGFVGFSWRTWGVRYTWKTLFLVNLGVVGAEVGTFFGICRRATEVPGGRTSINGKEADYR